MLGEILEARLLKVLAALSNVRNTVLLTDFFKKTDYYTSCLSANIFLSKSSLNGVKAYFLLM